ncbi:4'-phosphopantetheinyl transferase superfamily protein [Streptomyces sp. NBC_00335]|uniref:4'-phosphopantetheinyl transferase family protein n=1 Tax=unclassified Streptomyces TaxID=2593676 RepID=UPI00225455B0|nr:MULTISPECIES: 4'-phosphopantetheinyl transferase superfamily protein [unclassified Streptomyces]MCX5403977.1 4'-phosphopantetheinyl transferase superfamily protein [Streptomyces sp. NBC_00086]
MTAAAGPAPGAGASAQPWLTSPGPGLWAVRVSLYADRARESEGMLDAAERARLQGIRRAGDRDQYRVAHVVLRQLLGDRLGEDPARVRFFREPCPGCGAPHGRPAVPGVPLHFSLSHAGDAVLVAFADSPVGVDVEERPVPALAAQVASELAEVLHPAERAELAALPAEELPGAVARCWSRKEAYLKGIGIGLGGNPALTYVGTGATPSAPPGWTVEDVPAFPGYVAARAVRTGRVGSAS